MPFPIKPCSEVENEVFSATATPKPESDTPNTQNIIEGMQDLRLDSCQNFSECDNRIPELPLDTVSDNLDELKKEIVQESQTLEPPNVSQTTQEQNKTEVNESARTNFPTHSEISFESLENQDSPNLKFIESSTPKRQISKPDGEIPLLTQKSNISDVKTNAKRNLELELSNIIEVPEGTIPGQNFPGAAIRLLDGNILVCVRVGCFIFKILFFLYFID